LSEEKVAIIARATAVLTPQEARAAEALVLDRAGRLTPGALRSAIARAVIEVAPDKAKERREQAARQARVERWAEESGNAGLAGRELPAAQVHAVDQRISFWARQLKQAGLDGSTDELRARALMDLLLGTDSRPRPGGPGSDDPSPGPIPPGFVGHVNLTVPLTTALNLAERPGEIPGIGPGRPARWLRDLAAAYPRRRAGPASHPRPAHYARLRPPVPGPWPRPRRQAEAPVPDPVRHLHRDRLPKTLDPR
jgi:hypothetical protein